MIARVFTRLLLSLSLMWMASAALAQWEATTPIYLPQHECGTWKEERVAVARVNRAWRGTHRYEVVPEGGALDPSVQACLTNKPEDGLAQLILAVKSSGPEAIEHLQAIELLDYSKHAGLVFAVLEMNASQFRRSTFARESIQSRYEVLAGACGEIWMLEVLLIKDKYANAIECSHRLFEKLLPSRYTHDDLHRLAIQMSNSRYGAPSQLKDALRQRSYQMHSDLAKRGHAEAKKSVKLRDGLKDYEKERDQRNKKVQAFLAKHREVDTQNGCISYSRYYEPLGQLYLENSCDYPLDIRVCSKSVAREAFDYVVGSFFDNFTCQTFQGVTGEFDAMTFPTKNSVGLAKVLSTSRFNYVACHASDKLQFVRGKLGCWQTK